MSLTLSERLRAVEVRDARLAAGLQVFGLRWQANPGLSYRTLDEALAAGTLDITEVSQGGSVPLLKVCNRGDTPVFLMAGEQVVGAKQNRILNTSLLVPASTELAVPVSCVEAGRWHYRSPQFASAGTLSHGKLRKLMSEHTRESYTHSGWPASKQGEVWQEISRKMTSMHSVSPSAALQQTYEDHQARLQDLFGSLSVGPDCQGAAFVVGETVVGVDLFDRPATLAKLWPKVARAYAIDALEETRPSAPPLPAERVRDWLRSAAEAAFQTYKSPGLGYDVRLTGTVVLGGMLVVEEQPIHAELFAV
jgi:hypothetical protein